MRVTRYDLPTNTMVADGFTTALRTGDDDTTADTHCHTHAN